MGQQLICAGVAALGGMYSCHINILLYLVFGDTAVSVLPTYIKFSLHPSPTQPTSIVDLRALHHVGF
jgi:hypothetical protein